MTGPLVASGLLALVASSTARATDAATALVADRLIADLSASEDVSPGAIAPAKRRGFCPSCDDVDPRGVFVNPAQSEEPIESAIEAATKDFNFLARPIARSRLKNVSPVIKRVEIRRIGPSYVITLGTASPTTTVPGGPSVQWNSDDGDVLDVSTEWQDGILVQIFVAQDGKRFNRYTVAPDGTLVMDVTLTSPELQQPLRYQQTFQRETAQ